MLFRRTRKVVAELVGLVWLATEIAGLARSYVAASRRSRVLARLKEEVTWLQ
jgi:hypothetical protein